MLKSLDEDVEINVEVDGGITVVIGSDKDTSKPKRKGAIN
jgi:hypothetical protein